MKCEFIIQFYFFVWNFQQKRKGGFWSNDLMGLNGKNSKRSTDVKSYQSLFEFIAQYNNIYPKKIFSYLVKNKNKN